MKLRTSKRTTTDTSKLSSRGVHNGRIQQDKRRRTGSGGGDEGGGGVITKTSRKVKSGDNRTVIVSSSSSSVPEEDGEYVSNSAGIIPIRSRVIKTRSTNRKNALVVSEQFKGTARVLRSRNLNCTPGGGEGKQLPKSEIPVNVNTSVSAQIVNVRVTRSNSPQAQSSTTASTQRIAALPFPPSSSAPLANKKAQDKTAILEETSQISAEKSQSVPGPGVISKFPQRKKRRKGRKVTFKSRRASGGSANSSKRNRSGSVSKDTTGVVTLNAMHEDVAPSDGVLLPSCCEVGSTDVPGKDVVEATVTEGQNADADSEAEMADCCSESSGSDNTNSSNSDNDNVDKDGEGGPVSQISSSLEESANDSTSSSFLDGYTSNINYCAEDLNLFRDEYCPNGSTNPFGLSSVPSLNSTDTPQNLISSSCSQSDSSSSSTLPEELFSCTFSSPSWFQSQTSSPNQLSSIPSYDSTSSMFYQDSSGANCVPNSSLCKPGSSASGGIATPEYNSMMPCSSSATALATSSLWNAASGNSIWCSSGVNNNNSHDNLTDDESRGSWSQILEMSSSSGVDNNDKSGSSAVQYNEHNIHFGVPPTATSHELMQNQQIDYSQQLMYNQGPVNNAYSQEHNMDNTLITSCSPTNNAMAMPSPNYTYYTSKQSFNFCW